MTGSLVLSERSAPSRRRRHFRQTDARKKGFDNAQGEDEGAPRGGEEGERGEGKLKECDEEIGRAHV